MEKKYTIGRHLDDAIRVISIETPHSLDELHQIAMSEVQKIIDRLRLAAERAVTYENSVTDSYYILLKAEQYDAGPKGWDDAKADPIGDCMNIIRAAEDAAGVGVMRTDPNYCNKCAGYRNPGKTCLCESSPWHTATGPLELGNDRAYWWRQDENSKKNFIVIYDNKPYGISDDGARPILLEAGWDLLLSGQWQRAEPRG